MTKTSSCCCFSLVSLCSFIMKSTIGINGGSSNNSNGKLFIKLVLFIVLSQFNNLYLLNAERVEILMSNVTTQQDDAYICTSYKLGDDQKFITNIEPLTTADIAHHMFAFGCEKPAASTNSWNCGSVVCQGSKTILFAWGRNAPALQLPDDVAFKVGPTTNYKYIVVNIHYLKKVENDRSGLALSLSSKPRRYQAGIMLMVAGYIEIPRQTKKYSTDFSCKYEGKTIQVFAYRVHAHVHGDVNAAYRIRNHEWIQLAKGDPQWPQAFYPTEGTLDIKDGDALVGRCTYHNDEDRVIYAGATHNDEMCNVYLMYYTDDTSGVLDTCTGNIYPQLESIIPPEAERKPAPPASFNKNNADNSKNDIMSHHDMEGSKMHHELNDLPSKNKQKPSSSSSSQQQLPPKSLSYYLSQSDLNNDDYDYSDVERGRSKIRNSNNNNNNKYNELDSSNSDDAQPYYDTNALIEALNENDDYTDSAPSLLLAEAVAKLNGNMKGGGANGLGIYKSNQYLNNKAKSQIISITKYTYLENWYNSKELNLGQIGGIAINQKTDTIVIFHRGTQVWQMDSFSSDNRFNTRKYPIIPTDTIVTINRNTGKVINSWGSKMFYMPHGLTLDSAGNIWVTDVARHQVLKFAPNNTKEPMLEVGEKMEPGRDKNHFCQPADVAVLRNGDFFVADGYCNQRIVKFNKNGEYLTEWSSEDEKMPSHFFVPHSLALHETQNLLCVADRENYRIQCFDLNGNYLLQISSADFGPIYSVAFAANNASVLYAINGFNSRLDVQYDKKIFLISTKTGNIIGSINLNPEAATPHDLALSDDASEIYIANLNPAAVFKYVLVNYNIYTDKRKNGSKELVVKKDQINADKENFRTSMFIMAFLAIPLILVVVIALCVRLKNMGKLRKLQLVGVGSGLESKHKEIGKWISNKTNSKKRNGFTRLNQESEDEEAEHLTKTKNNSNSNQNNTDSDSESEVEIQLPTLSKA